MPRLPIVSPLETIKALEKAGFFVHHTKGSHHALRHQTDTSLRVTVPVHSRELPRGTLRSILRQANLSVEQFTELL